MTFIAAIKKTDGKERLRNSLVRFVHGMRMSR